MHCLLHVQQLKQPFPRRAPYGLCSESQRQYDRPYSCFCVFLDKAHLYWARIHLYEYRNGEGLQRVLPKMERRRGRSHSHLWKRRDYLWPTKREISGRSSLNPQGSQLQYQSWGESRHRWKNGGWEIDNHQYPPQNHINFWRENLHRWEGLQLILPEGTEALYNDDWSGAHSH